MAKAKSSIKGELAKIVRKKVEPSYLETLGVLTGVTKCPSILQAIALAQVKKGLEGDLKSAEFIEKLLCSNDGEENKSAEAFDVVVKVLDGCNGA